MKRALIVGASGGIGSAMLVALRAREVEVVGLSRSEDGLDVTDEASVSGCFAQLDGTFDFVFVAVGILAPDGGTPEKSVASIEADHMARVMAVNTIGPSLILKHAIPLLPRKTRSVVAVLSARVGSIGDNHIGGWHSYRASKAALNQIVRGAAIELGRTHKGAVCVALHPGTVETPFTAKYAGRHKTVAASDAAANLLNVIEQLGTDDTGQFFDWAGERVTW